jgi:Baculovirus major capsid protein VP39
MIVNDNNRQRFNMYCVFGVVAPLDFCNDYDSPCSDDAKVKDGWNVCDYHASKFFRIDKRIVFIGAANNTGFQRIVARSLVGEEDSNRVLVPNKSNYETVLGVEFMSMSERIVMYTIYDEPDKRTRIVEQLKYNERYDVDVIKDIFVYIDGIVASTRSDTLALQPHIQEVRTMGNEPEQLTYFNSLPPFIKNLVQQAVAPEQYTIGTKDLLLRNCNTCSITPRGLEASVRLYNPCRAKLLPKSNRFFGVRSVIEVEGSAEARGMNLGKYDRFAVEVLLYLGHSTMSTPPRYQNTIPI